MGHIDEALHELDDIDVQLTGYRVQLNAVSDDISYIESQNRGLQVQTSNQKALLDEMRQLLQIVEVPLDDLRTLTQESPQTSRGIQALEMAAASLYKALQAGRDTGASDVSDEPGNQANAFFSQCRSGRDDSSNARIPGSELSVLYPDARLPRHDIQVPSGSCVE